MPQFASRLAHPATPRMSGKSPASSPNRRPSPEDSGSSYDNGPVNGQVDAFTLNFGYAVSNSIQFVGAVQSLNFWAWLVPGDTISSVEVSIGSQPFGSDQFDGIVNLTASDCFTNDFGYNVCLEFGNFNPSNVSGNAWVTLQNANLPNGDPVYWDENSGVGCQSAGCPSLAQDNNIGTIPSEAFTINGNPGSPVCFESQGNLQILHSFTPQQGGPYPGANGVLIDRMGNLYGTTADGGDNSAGFAFKLIHASDWLLDPLYSFLGGSSGSDLSGAILGANGSLYGGAQGGIQNCGTDGSQYCGLVFNLRPQPTACLSALCSWTENVPYRFSSESDGSGVINLTAQDQQGNLYGTTTTGGIYGAGTVFELTPSGGAWTKATLYSFTGGDDGSYPIQVLLGHDGNLYGVAGGTLANGVVFQLTGSGGQWTESVVHSFGNTNPRYLVQDSAGILYGIYSAYFVTGEIFSLQRAGSGWTFSEYPPTDSPGHSDPPGNIPYGDFTQLAIDTAGTLYGTGYAGTTYVRSPGNGPAAPDSYETFIFKASYASGNWQYQNLRVLNEQYFPSSGSLAFDANGNLYGTTPCCGTNGYGAVWQLSR